MSFILDALRKSETARRRSEAPDLFTTMPSAAPPAPQRRQWPMLAVGGVGVLSLVAALWLFAQRTPAPATVETSAAAARSVEANAPPPEPAPADPAGTHPTRDIAAVEPPLAPAVPALRVPAPAEPVVATPTPPREAQPAPATPSPVVEPARDPPAPPVVVAPPGDRVVSIADLDPGTRSQLPSLKLSMHLWNETPSQRFVILDGQRMKEGDAIGEIVIERITRDGAVLAWRDGRLKIELR